MHDEIARRLMRRVTGAEGEPCQPRLVRSAGDMLRDEADRLIDPIFGEMVAGLVAARWRDAGIVAHQLRRVLVGLRIHEAVIAVEATPERPAVERTGGARFRQWRDVPLAEHVVAIAMRAQHLGNGSRAVRNLAAIAGIAAVEIGKA